LPITSATRRPSATADADVKPASTAATANPEINPRRSMLTLIRLTPAVYRSPRDAATAEASLETVSRIAKARHWRALLPRKKEVL
jgi:hypothetical protein